MRHQVNGVKSSPASSVVPPGLRRHARNEEPAGSLDSERVRLLYSNLPASIAVSLLLALFLVSVQALVIDPDRLLGWSALLSAILLGRGLLYIAWRKAGRTDERVADRPWLQWFRITVITTGIIWGIGGILLAPPDSMAHRIYVSFVLAGLCAGGATTLAIDRISVSGFLLSVLVPQAFFLAEKGDAVSYGMAGMDILFLGFLLASARQARLQLEDNYQLRHRAIENEQRFREMLENSPIATRIADAASGQVVFANQSYIALIESTPEEVIGVMPSNYYAHPEDYMDVIAQIDQGHHVINKLVELHHPDIKEWVKWALASYFPLEYRNRPAILGWFYDITDRKLMEDHVEHLAYHDPLTGLPNRSLFRDRLKQAIVSAEREKNTLALMFVDLDRFKPVNDEHGHNIGDQLLKAVAERILGCLRKADSAGRIGGDEFVVLLPVIRSEANALEVAEKIRNALNKPFEIEGLTLDISSSTGVAIYPDHADGEQQLIKHADIAMYYAKSEGRDKVKAYRPEMS